VVPLLERLAKRRTPLTVQVPGHAEQFGSCIVDVDRQNVLLDELLPSNGHALLLAERSLQVTGKLDGIDISFNATLQRVDDKDKVITYYMKLPAQLEYRQRRLDYRVHVPMTKRLRVIIDSNDGSVIEGEVHDLSRGGAGLIFPDGNPVVEPGLLHECAVELSEGDWLYCTVELRYSKTIPSRHRQLIGAMYIDLDAEQARLIGSRINELEREFIRKRAAS
jgi:c-di-GMP-binding flagellar brake protein YcgR